jgi:hypothetical protein
MLLIMTAATNAVLLITDGLDSITVLAIFHDLGYLP